MNSLSVWLLYELLSHIKHCEVIAACSKEMPRKIHLALKVMGLHVECIKCVL